MKHLKALGLVVLSSMIALFIGVGSASAAFPAPYPDWNNDPDHWTGVDVTDCWSNSALPTSSVPCDFKAFVEELGTVTFQTTPPTPLLTCDATLDISVFEDGEDLVTSLALVPGLINGFLCPTVQTFSHDTGMEVDLDDLDWPTQICEETHDAEGNPLAVHRYWDAVYVNFSVGGGAPAEGWIYVQLDDSTSATTSPLDVDSTLPFTSPIQGNPPYGLDAPNGAMFYGDDPDNAPERVFTVESNEDPCAWSTGA